MTRSAQPPRSGRRTAGRRAGRTPPSRPGRRSSARRAETACRSGRVRRHHGERRGGTSDGHLSARANRAPAPARVAVVLGLRRRRPLPRDGHEPAVGRPRRPPADRPPHPPDGPRAELFPDWRHFITNRTQDITSLRPSTVTTPSTNRSSPSPRTKRWCTSPPGTSTPPASPRSRWRGFAVGSGVRAGRSLARTGARQTRHARDRAQPVPGWTQSAPRPRVLTRVHQRRHDESVGDRRCFRCTRTMKTSTYDARRRHPPSAHAKGCSCFATNSRHSPSATTTASKMLPKNIFACCAFRGTQRRFITLDLAAEERPSSPCWPARERLHG